MPDTPQPRRGVNGLAYQYLRCPVCYGQLEEAYCTVCQEPFPQTMGIPDLRWPRPAEEDATRAKETRLPLIGLDIICRYESPK